MDRPTLHQVEHRSRATLATTVVVVVDLHLAPRRLRLRHRHHRRITTTTMAITVAVVVVVAVAALLPRGRNPLRRLHGHRITTITTIMEEVDSGPRPHPRLLPHGRAAPKIGTTTTTTTEEDGRPALPMTGTTTMEDGLLPRQATRGTTWPSSLQLRPSLRVPRHLAPHPPCPVHPLHHPARCLQVLLLRAHQSKVEGQSFQTRTEQTPLRLRPPPLMEVWGQEQSPESSLQSCWLLHWPVERSLGSERSAVL